MIFSFYFGGGLHVLFYLMAFLNIQLVGVGRIKGFRKPLIVYLVLLSRVWVQILLYGACVV